METIIKNNSGIPVNIQVLSIVVYPGWNPEIFYELENVVENTLQFGY